MEGTWSGDPLSRLEPPASRLLGRESDLATICSLLLRDEVRLLTLTGPAGVGKTSLALEIGVEVHSHFAQGVVFVDLTTVRAPANVLLVVGEHLGFRDLEDEVLRQRLQAYLAQRELLLILDNVEHVLAAAPRLVELLAAAPRSKLLVTSREPLHLRLERIFHVPTLALPDLRALRSIGELTQIPSVALFLQQAEAINPDFALDEENAPAVTELVVRLDGLPLAIELAAARTSLLSPQMILERLGRRLSLLRWQAQDLPQRHQALRSAIAWSYELLSPEEQTLFRHLGVFTAGFSLEAAEAVAEPLCADALEGVTSLVDKNLIQVQGRSQGQVRYVLLESMRAFARELLTVAGELEEAGRTHALYYLELAERAESELTGREQRRWFARLEWTHDNLRTASRWLLDHGEGERALRLATALGYFWEARGYVAEGQRWLEEALTAAPAAEPHLRARALSWLGILMIWTARDEEASTVVLTEVLELARSLGDPATIARSLTYLGLVGHFTKDWDLSRRYLDEALTAWQEAGDCWGIASALLSRGTVEFRQEHYPEAV